MSEQQSSDFLNIEKITYTCTAVKTRKVPAKEKLEPKAKRRIVN